MRTKIEATWIVGHERGHHTLIRDGEVVFEGNKILHVGKGFEGKVDKVIDAKGKLLSPGFIDTHVHSGHRASHRLITDTGRPMYYGQPFLEISVPKEGKVVKGDPRYLKHGDAGSAAAFELNAAFTVAELIRNGVTTFVEYGSQLSVQDALLAPAGTPKEITTLVHREVVDIIAQPAMKEQLAALGFQPIGNTPEQFAAQIRTDIGKRAKLIRAAGIGAQ